LLLPLPLDRRPVGLDYLHDRGVLTLLDPSPTAPLLHQVGVQPERQGHYSDRCACFVASR